MVNHPIAVVERKLKAKRWIPKIYTIDLCLVTFLNKRNDPMTMSAVVTCAAIAISMWITFFGLQRAALASSKLVTLEQNLGKIVNQVMMRDDESSRYGR